MVMMITYFIDDGLLIQDLLSFLFHLGPVYHDNGSDVCYEVLSSYCLCQQSTLFSCGMSFC